MKTFILSVLLLSELFCLNVGDYAFFPNAKTYQNAQQFCESVGGNLAPIISEEDRDNVMNMIEDDSIWIGLYSTRKIGWFLFEDETVECPNIFSGACVNFWRSGHPRCIEKNKGYKCTSFYPADDAVDNDVSCDHEKPFLCFWVDPKIIYVNTAYPTSPTTSPTNKPVTAYPTTSPTNKLVTAYPTTSPTNKLVTAYPTTSPTNKLVTAYPTTSPTNKLVTAYPTYNPTPNSITDAPTSDPTNSPVSVITSNPTGDSTYDLTHDPTSDPTSDPTNDPTADPTTDPTTDPTALPTIGPGYGGDYGDHTNGFECDDRKCCWPLVGISDPLDECRDLSLETCMSDTMRDKCDWNCDDRQPLRRADGMVRGDRYRIRTYLYRQQPSEIGYYEEEPVSNDDPIQLDSWPQLKEWLIIQEIDECGYVFENKMDDITAQYDFDHYNEGGSQSASNENTLSRRLIVFGHDDQKEVKTKQWPQNRIGLLRIQVAGGVAGCSGTQINRRYILTTGHCCHAGNGGNYFGWTNWYAGVLKESEVVANEGLIRITHAWVFAKWRTDSVRAYDICMLKLKVDNPGWLGWGSDPTITQQTIFSFYGYPNYKRAIDLNKLKWGHDVCKANVDVTSDELRYTYDTGEGQSGSGLWQSDHKVNCVHVGANNPSNPYRWNACARITGSKYKTMLDIMSDAYE